jgi:hypothetical protein
MYFEGRDLPQDHAVAVGWFKGGRSGQRYARTTWARCLRTAQAFLAIAVAASWHHWAADRGLPCPAQPGLSAPGEGVPQSDDAAAYGQAANQEFGLAQYNLDACMRGSGVPKNAATAVRPYRKAADQGMRRRNSVSASHAAVRACRRICQGDAVVSASCGRRQRCRAEQHQSHVRGWPRRSANQRCLFRKEPIAATPRPSSASGECTRTAGVRRDYVEPSKWYAKSADQGIPGSVRAPCINRPGYRRFHRGAQVVSGLQHRHFRSEADKAGRGEESRSVASDDAGQIAGGSRIRGV